MEKDIKFFYGLDVEIIDNRNDCYLLFCDDSYYFYIKCSRSDTELKDIVNVCLELQKKKIVTDKVIFNIYNNCISNGYVLLKISYFLDDEMSLEKLLQYNKKLINKNNYVNHWGELWSRKVDYLENRLKDVKNKKIVMSSFDYYVGLAENAIVMLNIVNNKYPKDTIMVLSRNRIKYPLYYKDYFNPMFFIFDTRIRDIVGYLKSKFFSGEDIKNDLDIIFRDRYSIYECNLLYARMLYPSYYFDVLEKVINEDVKEEALLSIFDKVDEYEELLNYLYKYLSKFCYIENIEWLNKKE